jgi:hypothetical protein
MYVSARVLTNRAAFSGTLLLKLILMTGTSLSTGTISRLFIDFF